MRPVEVVLSSEAQEVFEYLNKESVHSKNERVILDAIKYKSDLIKANRMYGDAISKRLIPKEYVIKYCINNLFRVELPNFWRMLYTLRTEKNEIEIIAFVIEIVDHKKYNKRFGYK